MHSNNGSGWNPPLPPPTKIKTKKKKTHRYSGPHILAEGKRYWKQCVIRISPKHRFAE